MIDYIVFRENFQADTWDAVGRVRAENPESAVREVFPSNQVNEVFGTYAAVPTDEFIQLFSDRPLVRITAKIETLDPIATVGG